jgi:glutamyl-tRNA synthetase
MRFLKRRHQSPVLGFPLGLFTSYGFCFRTFTSVEYIEKAIIALQGRLVTLMDLPTAAPYLFVSPAWDDAEARAMLDRISITDYQNVIQGTITRLRSTSRWDVQTIISALHAENSAAGVKPVRFMTVLRHAMSGVKVRFFWDFVFSCKSNRLRQSGPSIAEIMDVLGTQRTIARLEEAVNLCHTWVPS